LLAAGLVMCGGSADLAGFRELGQQVLQLPVRVGRPHDLQGLTDVLESPAYATSVGLLLWGMRHEAMGQPEPTRRRPPNEIVQRVRNWFRAFLPG
jgi:cell division protein FtsA